MDIKKRKVTAKRVRPTQEEPESESDSDAEPTGVVRPGEATVSRKRKRVDLESKSAESRPEDIKGSAPAPVQSSNDVQSATNGNSTAVIKPESKEESKTEVKVGPVKAASAIRMTTFTDFAPDVCKDYKKTGFCGFGDSCKFLHAREDYKQGWALDEAWEKSGKEGTRPSGTVFASAAHRKQGLGNDAERVADEDEEERKMLEKIPFACTICEKPYTNPIVTKCGHYFCEACALKRFRKSPSCAVCGAGTGGVFNGAKKLKELLKRKKEREEAQATEQEA